jgi:glycosyltransferase involved in cell wall biosynthesis
MHHERLGLGDRFRFMGSTRDPHGVMADADLVLLTSISEGLPLALLEAMAQARPVVATAVGGVPDVVRGCGLVAAPGDADALARACVTLLRDPDLAERLGRRGLNRVRRRFRLDDCIAGFRNLIGELTDEVAA